MSLKREIEVFDHVGISAETGETDVWDRVVFPQVIRKREIERIIQIARKVNPKRTLDYGCGTGWVSRALASNGYNTIGVDTSGSLISSATGSPQKSSQFAIADCMNLPFAAESFDLVVGIAILHHLDINHGLAECHRVLSSNGALLLMEPNKYNPLAALARKISPVDTQTPDEEPLSPWHLRNEMEKQGWRIEKFGYLFPYSFGLSQVLRRSRLDKPVWKPLCGPVRISERVWERLPFLKHLCWVIVVEAKKA